MSMCVCMYAIHTDGHNIPYFRKGIFVVIFVEKDALCLISTIRRCHVRIDIAYLNSEQ